MGTITTYKKIVGHNIDMSIISANGHIHIIICEETTTKKQNGIYCTLQRAQMKSNVLVNTVRVHLASHKTYFLGISRNWVGHKHFQVLKSRISKFQVSFVSQI